MTGNSTTDAVFAAAASATSWTRTNLGPRTEVTQGAYTWTVQLPQHSGNAFIAWRTGHGGTEHIHNVARPAQTVSIVEAAMSALRLP